MMVVGRGGGGGGVKQVTSTAGQNRTERDRAGLPGDGQTDTRESACGRQHGMMQKDNSNTHTPHHMHGVQCWSVAAGAYVAVVFANATSHPACLITPDTLVTPLSHPSPLSHTLSVGCWLRRASSGPHPSRSRAYPQHWRAGTSSASASQDQVGGVVWVWCVLGGGGGLCKA